MYLTRRELFTTLIVITLVMPSFASLMMYTLSDNQYINEINKPFLVYNSSAMILGFVYAISCTIRKVTRTSVMIFSVVVVILFALMIASSMVISYYFGLHGFEKNNDMIFETFLIVNWASILSFATALLILLSCEMCCYVNYHEDDTQYDFA
jgi:hypothetical protein